MMAMTALGADDIGLSDLAFAMEFEDPLAEVGDAGDVPAPRHRCMTHCPAQPAPWVEVRAQEAGAGRCSMQHCSHSLLLLL